MKRSMYSLILSDHIVAAVDELAYQRGMSRSALVNQILAEAVSFRTPERCRRDAYQAMCERFSRTVFLKAEPSASDSTLWVRSRLQYRYNPTMQYTVALYNDESGTGVFKASIRTTNAALLELLCGFYRLWTQLERAAAPHEIHAAIKDGCYLRTLRPPAQLSADDTGALIAEYVHGFDTMLKRYIAAPDQTNALAAAYRQLLLDGFPQI